MLLFNYVEGVTQLYWKSNAPQLPGLLWGKFRRMKCLIRKGKGSFSKWIDICSLIAQFLFDTTKDITVLRCGHTMHLECVKEMERHFQYVFKGSCWFMLITCIHFFVPSITLKMYKLLAGTHALFAQNPVVICLVCGKNLMRRYFNSSFNFPKKIT